MPVPQQDSGPPAELSRGYLWRAVADRPTVCGQRPPPRRRALAPRSCPRRRGRYLGLQQSLPEAKFAMLLVQPVLLVTDESCSGWYPELHSSTIPSLKWRILLSSLPSKFPNECSVLTMDKLKFGSQRCSSSNYSWAPEGAVIICFTSGTTGRPKGVTISHSALIAQSMAKIAICGYDEDDIYLHSAPLCHIGGLSSAMAMLMVGACHVLMPKFDAKLAIEVIEKWDVTSLITVPAMMADLISLLRGKEWWKGKDSMKKILNGGGSLSPELIRGATIIFPKAKILSAYGMTEACSSLTFMTLYDPIFQSPDQANLSSRTNRQSSSSQQGIPMGKPAPHVDIRTDADDSLGVGRILVRGPNLMLKYWNQAPTLDCKDQQWFDTGDIGFIDDHGELWLIGREKGRIKSGGENIYPEEVEAVLSQHPGVHGVVVVGVPELRLSEMVVGCVQLKENWQWSNKAYGSVPMNEDHNVLSGEILRQFCKENNLTGFKIPRVFYPWRKAFPTTSTGKVVRGKLRDEVILHLQPLQGRL
ncbi:2-succinylbenzoate--CoA ligase, chloroplastic/peroxisomal isoform X2 [Punica granatum]|uniref:2-succinylbenzoate--CoA ligase, chloroplastic/peroxisomal isoform X2 n=1 Tax=Punica granatum TaxID=22663 RepID=A0A6P8E7B7_PUNGR|nr:2-succinylbenzoate--CoA ligase, chloroplastic/peroxisomal isoform X2 [Punica granatum]